MKQEEKTAEKPKVFPSPLRWVKVYEIEMLMPVKMDKMYINPKRMTKCKVVLLSSHKKAIKELEDRKKEVLFQSGKRIGELEQQNKKAITKTLKEIDAELYGGEIKMIGQRRMFINEGLEKAKQIMENNFK